MKKSDIAKIIDRLTDLEVKMARDIYSLGYKKELIASERLNELTKISSDLDKIWKGKSN